jgi:hypothetical protein
MANTFKSYTKANIGTLVEDVYTVPGSTTSVVIGFVLSNVSATDPVTADVLVNKAAAVDDVYLVKGIELYTGSAYEVMAGNKIILETGDKIQVNSNTNSSVDVLLSVLEQT